MEIEGPNIQEENQRIFNDYLSRQPILNQKEFTLDIDNYRSVSLKGAQQIIKDPSKYYVLIKKFLQSHSQQHTQLKRKFDTKVDHYSIKIQGNLGANFVTPRGLNSRMANQLVGLQGIITKMDISKAYLEKSIHWCQKTKSFQTRNYPDSFNPEKDNQLNKARTIKTTDDQNNPLQFQYGQSSFKNTQLVVIQQLPEMAPPGLLPMSVQVVLQSDLVGAVKPGDRVQMVGIYKLITGQNSKQKGIFKPYFICLSIRPLQQLASMMKRPSKTDFPKQQIFDLFSRSIAPSIWGHQHLKKAVLLMLVGGIQKNLQTGTHLRGDINLLVIGDPGTAKSQMLRWVLSTVDISVGTTGSGASGVGLTAAIVADKQTGQRTLQAGAMVLADRGVVCIDQFDKMNQTDRVAVHEVMEQQTVTISKAGLHCSLNARCAVIAAANPIYGQYQRNLPPTKNIGMPDSLLSRFDLIFVVLDEKNNARDKQISQKVCRNHRLAPQSNDFMNQYMNPEDYVVNPIQQKRQQQGAVYEKNNVYKAQGNLQLVNQTFLKRYINYVKTTIEPMLTDKAVEFMAQLWKLLRQKDFQQKQNVITKVLPVTIRTHQSLIRLSTAHAKLLQQSTVEVENVFEAFKLMVFCYYSDQNALDEQIEIILKNLQIDDRFNLRALRQKNRIYEPQKKEQHQNKRKMQPEEEMSKKMEKLNIREGQKQLKQAFDKHVINQEDLKFSKDQRALVYKACSELKRKKRGSENTIHFNQLWSCVQKGVLSKKRLDAILQDLQKDNKLTVENGIIFMI